MAPKNKRKLKLIRKEKMLIISRLIKMRLIVDDYIYNKKPISILEATKLLEEVTSLKIKCEQDERSLQVIEKLKTFMKSIIKEQSTCDPSDVINIRVDNNHMDECNVKDIKNINIENLNTGTIDHSDYENHHEVNHSQDNRTISKSSNTLNPVTNNESPQFRPEDIIERDLTSLEKDTTEENPKRRSESIYLHEDEELTEFHTETLNIIPYKESEKTANKNKKEIQEKSSNNTKNKKNIDAKNTKTKSKEITNCSRSKQKSKMDLSFMENIRYVREICTDEHTHLQVEDTFWTDSSLPAMFDDFDQ